MDITFTSQGTKRTRRHNTQTDPSTNTNGSKTVADTEPELDSAKDLHFIRRASHPSALRSLDEGQLARTDLAKGQQPSVIGDDQGTGSGTSVALQVEESNDVATEFEPSVAQSQSIAVNHKHRQSNRTSSEQNPSCLNMALTQSAYPGVRDTTSLSSSQEHGLACLGNVDLEVLDYLASNPSNLDLLAANNSLDPTIVTKQTGVTRTLCLPTAPESVVESSPDLYKAYYPDAAYKDLHSQLHDHIVETARNIALTRQGTPEPFHTTLPESPLQHSLSLSSRQGVSPTFPGARRLMVDAHVTQRRAVELWQNYLDEIAPWLDMFDDNNHWQTTVAQMAQRVECLQYSLLALSARQQERKSPAMSHTESLSLYQEAIRLVTIQLPTLCTEIIAAVILLCVLEMMSSSPRAWARHLDGCAILLETAGVNGAVGGVRQTLFWTFARMDVYKAFISDSITNLPTNRWYVSTDSMSAAVHQFKGEPGSGSYANYGIFLCAGVVNILWNKNLVWAPSDHDRHRTFVSRWKALYDLLEGWYNDRPEEMKPLMDLPPSKEETHLPFNTILYSTPPGISGNQVYHASMILLLQDRPKEIRLPKSHKSMLWHARQICGIALSNSDHGALINALQPIWIAGKLMSHHSEHKALLDTLKRLEEETGWATSWRAKDLQEFWGVCDEGP